VYLCGALFVVPHTQGAQTWITQCYLQITPMPAFTSLTFTRWRKSNCSLLLIYLPRKDEKLSRPGWLTYSGRFTHISGHPSAVGRVQDGKFAGQRPTFYHCTTQPTQTKGLCLGFGRSPDSRSYVAWRRLEMTFICRKRNALCVTWLTRKARSID